MKIPFVGEIKFIRTDKKVREFSKNTIVFMVFSWFVVGAFACYMTWVEPSNLSYLLEYFGNPVSGAIMLYMVKSAFENCEKIKKSEEKGSDHP